MPQFFSKIHDRLIDNFTSTSKERVVGNNRLILPVNSDGFVVPSNLLVKVLPTLENGIQFVGFMREIKNYYCYPYEKSEEDY